MTDRIYTEKEMAALLKRAAELHAHDAQARKREPGLTLAELEAVAAESGIDPAMLRRAAAELDAPARSLPAADLDRSGTHNYVERWVPGPLTDEGWEDVVLELRHRFDSDLGAMMGMSAPGYGRSTTEQIGRSHEWRHTSMSGIETRVLVRPQGDGLHVRLSQRVGWGSAVAESATYGGALSALMAFIAGAAMKSGLIAVAVLFVALLATIPLIYVLDTKWRERKHGELEHLADRVASLLAVPAATAAPVADAHADATLDAAPPLDATLLDADPVEEPPARSNARRTAER